MSNTRAGIMVTAPKIQAKSVDAMANAVALVLEVGFDSHADQETIRHALDTLRAGSTVENVCISGCSVRAPR